METKGAVSCQHSMIDTSLAAATVVRFRWVGKVNAETKVVRLLRTRMRRMVKFRPIAGWVC